MGFDTGSEAQAHRSERRGLRSKLRLLRGLGGGVLLAHVVHVESPDLLDELLERGGRKGAGLTEDRDAVAVDDEGRDRADPVLPSEVLLGVGVHLREGDVGVLLALVLEDGTELATRSAPGGPEIDEDDAIGDGVVVGVLGESRSWHSGCNAAHADLIPRYYAPCMPVRTPRDRVAVVTGAARGIGAAIAVRLAEDGLDVAVIDLDEASTADTLAAIRGAGARAIGIGADVSDAAAVERAVARVANELGAPTVLVNNAGILRDNLIFKMTEDDWDAVLGVHLRGAFLMTRAVQAHQVAAQWGRIVNLSSTSALGNRGQANYAAAKAGMQGFTKTLAIELGRYNVTANAIAPGFIATDMLRATAERVGMPFEDFLASAAKDIPVGRVGQPADVAAAASFFCSDAASFVSGQVLYVAGGPKD